jgi:glycosyltransferase involved in cell wall biosynthesis
MRNLQNGKRVLVVLEAGDAYPSGFLRGLIYKDCFEHDGFEVEYVSRLLPWLVRILDAPPQALSPWFALGFEKVLRWLLAGAGRIKEKLIVRKARDYDVVYMSKVTSLRLVSKLRGTGARLVLDFGDALWLPGRSSAGFHEVLRSVDAVTTDNELTAEYVRKLNPNCTVIPDCPQLEWFDRRRSEWHPAENSTITLGWVGTTGTVYNLYVIWEALERLFPKYPNLHLRLLGLGTNPRLLPPFEKVKYSYRSSYSQSEMIDEVLGMDIGLFPLQDVEASRVRGVLKATVYMAGQAVAVCSPVGQCSDLIQDGVNGMLARTPEEWEKKIEELILNPTLRQQIAQAGLETMRSQFTVARSFAKLRKVLDGANGEMQAQ